jgi:hypothetical protein
MLGHLYGHLNLSMLRVVQSCKYFHSLGQFLFLRNTMLSARGTMFRMETYLFCDANMSLSTTSPTYQNKCPHSYNNIYETVRYYVHKLNMECNVLDCKRFSFTFSRAVVTVCTTRCNTHKFCILSTECIYGLRMILKINSKYFIKQH